MASFQFPDPNVTQTVTNPVTGTVYQWQDSSGKWTVTTLNTDAGFVERAGDTMTGPLAIDPPGPINTDTPLFSIDNSLGGGSEKIIKVNTTAASPALQLNNDALSIALPDITLSTSSSKTSGQTGLNIKGADNVNLLTQFIDTTQDPKDDIRYYGGIRENESLTTKAYVDTAVGNGKVVTISTESPANPNDGDLWFDSSEDSLTLFIYYEASSAWVPAAPPSTLEGRIEEGEETQREILQDLDQAKTDIINNTQNHLDLSEKVDALEGVTTAGNWTANTSSSARPGDFLLYKADFTAATVWADATSIGIQPVDADGISHSFGPAIDDTIRLRYDKGDVSLATYKIEEILNNGWFKVRLTSEIGVPQDGDVYNVEFLPSFDPTVYATMTYVDNQDDKKLDLTGGTLTGTLRNSASIITDTSLVTNTAGTNYYGFLLKDKETGSVRLGISHPSASADAIRYKPLTGARHAFYGYDSDGTNGKEVFSIYRTSVKIDTDLNINAPGNIRYKNDAGATFFNLFQQSTTECRLNVQPGKSLKITGTYDGTLSNLFQVTAAGELLLNRVITPTADTMAANKSYVDSKVVSAAPDATGAIKGVAKLGQLPQGTSVPALDKGQLFYNTSNKTLLLKS
tara:strand:+ start:680 stop:2563 length:1884 start_codon:yes stop_codon:yes gene_type:complete